MKKLILTGIGILGIICPAYGQECEQENARLQAALKQVQNLTLMNIVFDADKSLLLQEIKALKEERAKSSAPAEPTTTEKKD